MEFESTLTRNMYLTYLLTRTFRSWGAYMLFAILLFLLIWGIVIKDWPIMIYPIGIFVVFVLYYSIWFIYQCYMSKDKRFFFSKRHISISEEQIILQVSGWEETVKWEAFYCWKEIAGCYGLYYFNGRMIIIPIRDIPVDRITELEALLAKRIDKTVTIRKTEVT